MGYQTLMFSYSVTAFRHNDDKLNGMPRPAFIETRFEGCKNGIEGFGDRSGRTLVTSLRWLLDLATPRSHAGKMRPEGADRARSTHDS